MKILSKPKGNAEEYGRWSVNPYKGCPHGCTYCYLKKGAWAKGLGGNVPTLKAGLVNEEHAFHVAMAEIIENQEDILKDGGVFMSFVTDPMCKETKDLFLKIANACMTMLREIPVTVLTKSAYFKEDFFNRIPSPRYNWKSSYIAFGFTLTGHDELEPYASSNADRIEAIKFLNNQGYKTWASIEPVIDFNSSYDMILQALDVGCRHFKIGLMTNNTKVCRKKYNHDACIEFIHNVMRVMEAGGGTATVYWKQSFRDFLGEEDFARATVGYKNIVDKDWSMFNQEYKPISK